MVNMRKQEDWGLREEMLRMQQELNQLRRRAARPTTQRRARVFPSMVISASDDKLVVQAEVPGMKLESFDISVSGDTLTVQGLRDTGEGLEGGWYHRRERQSGQFSRALRLPAPVDGEKAEATYVAGVLTILLPLRAPAKPKQITITVAEG